MSASPSALPTLPPALLAELEAEARDQHRSTSELLEEAVRRHVEHLRWLRLLAYGEAQARTLGLTEDDVPRLVEESRREARAERP